MRTIILTSNTSYSVFNFRIGLIRCLKENGHNVIVLAPYDDYSKLLEKECKYYKILNLERKGTNPIKDLKLLFEYLRYYKKLKPDTVISYTIKPNIYSAIACRILKIPTISVVTGLGYVFQRDGLLKKIVKLLYKLSLNMCYKVLVLNKDDALELEKLLCVDKIMILPSSGINTEHFSKNFCKNILCNHFKEVNVFLYLGRFLKDKGIVELIEAGKILWKERNDFEIWLVGGIDENNPATLTSEDIDKIKMLSFVKIFPFVKDVREFICKSDVVVYPSYREGIPRALLEAMAMEKPIITTDSVGCREVIRDGINGLIAKPKDVSSLYQAMRKFMYLDNTAKKLMGLKGREMVINMFDEKITNKHYLDLIYELGHK